MERKTKPARSVRQTTTRTNGIGTTRSALVDADRSPMEHVVLPVGLIPLQVYGCSLTGEWDYLNAEKGAFNVSDTGEVSWHECIPGKFVLGKGEVVGRLPNGWGAIDSIGTAIQLCGQYGWDGKYEPDTFVGPIANIEAVRRSHMEARGLVRSTPIKNNELPATKLLPPQVA